MNDVGLKSRTYSRRGLVSHFLPSKGTDAASSTAATAKCKLSVGLVHDCGEALNKVTANILAGQQSISDYHSAADTYEALGSHFQNLQIDRYLGALLPTSNTTPSHAYPDGYIDHLRTYNPSVPSDTQMLPQRLPTGSEYTQTRQEILKKGMSGAFYASSEVCRMAAKVQGAQRLAQIQRPHIISAVYHNSAHFQNISFCGVTKADVCAALKAITGATLAMAAPALVLCTLGALTATVAFVVETEGLGAVEAAEMYAEADEVCDALASNTLNGISGVVGSLSFLLGC